MQRHGILKILLVGLGLLATQTMASEQRSEHFRYGTLVVDTIVQTLKPNQAPPALDQNIISINVGEKNGGVTGEGSDYIVPASVCSTKSPLICFHSDMFNFAVPRNFPNGPRSWDSGRFHYYVFGAPYTSEILGEKLKVWIIKSIDPRDPYYETQYVYSPERGLIAFATLHKGGGVDGMLDLLLDRCGYAAHDCKLESSQIGNLKR